jgi:hypothetical protein
VLNVRADESLVLIDGINKPLVQPRHDLLSIEFPAVKCAGGVVELAAAVIT